MEVVLLLFLGQELEYPAVLDLLVGGHVLLEKDEGVHLAEELLATRVVCLCPEVFALDSQFICQLFELGVNFFVVILLLLWIVRELLEYFDRLLDFLLFPACSLVPCGVPDLSVGVFKGLPILAFG